MRNLRFVIPNERIGAGRSRLGQDHLKLTHPAAGHRHHQTPESKTQNDVEIGVQAR